MAKDVTDVIGTALGRLAREAAQSVSSNGRRGSGPLSGMRGVAAGAGAAALAPLAAKGAGRLAKRAVGNGAPVKAVGDKVGKGVKDAVGKSVEDAGGAAGMVKEAGKRLVPGGGGGKDQGEPGVGKGRRMPIQQAVDVGVPRSVAYNQWTQFEEWPNFMHRVDRVSQEDETHVSFKTKIWGISKEFEAEIVEQRPDQRIKWRVTDGLTHSGVVTFHELDDSLTRIEVNLDVQPGSLLEKAARGMRHIKRAVRADLARFKAYVVMQEEETGAWRGVVDDGKVKSSARNGRSSSRRRTSSARSRSSASRSRGSSNGSSRSASGARSRSGSSRKASSARS